MDNKAYKSPLSRLPWMHYGSFEELPVLDKSDGKALWMVLGVTFGLLGAGVTVGLFMTKTASQVDPMLWESFFADIVLWTILLVITGLIGIKQWHYYYGNGSPKDGIFVQKIRQASTLEQYSDVALSFAGGLLIGLVALPSYWFVGFALYCTLVVLRCYITLMRPKYAEKARKNGYTVPDYIDKSIGALHNGLLVKGVLAGWIVSDAMYIIYALLSFILCICVVSKFCLLLRLVSFLIIAGTLAVLFLHVVRRYSYTWGLWLLSRLDMLAPGQDNQSPHQTQP